MDVDDVIESYRLERELDQARRENCKALVAEGRLEEAYLTMMDIMERSEERIAALEMFLLEHGDSIDDITKD